MGPILKLLTSKFVLSLALKICIALLQSLQKKENSLSEKIKSDGEPQASKTIQQLKSTIKNLDSNSRSVGMENNISVGNDVPPWLNIAAGELGISEKKGKLHNKRILEYHQATRLKAEEDEVSWCSAFACWCLEKAGFESPFSGVARSFLRWGQEVSVPYKGCISVFSRPGGESWQGHVGFYIAENQTEIFILSGNVGNKVTISPIKKDRLLGYREPKSGS